MPVYLKVHQSLVSEKFLEDSTVAVTVSEIENLWCDLKNVVAAHKPKSIRQPEPMTNEEESFRKLPKAGGYASHLQQVITTKSCSTKY